MSPIPHTMPRAARIAPGGIVFHTLNHANRRARIFEHPGDYDAFERVVGRTLECVPMRILAYCVMPNHWHFILWPHRDGDLQAFMHRLITTHVRRWHLHRYFAWADLLRRTSAIDALACQDCGGRLRLLAAIEDREVTEKNLIHLGLPVEPPSPAPARSPTWLPGFAKALEVFLT